MSENIQVSRVAESLSQCIRYKTIATHNNEYQKEFFAIMEFFNRRYPKIFRGMQYKNFHNAMLLRLKGASDERPMLLMAHQDVVKAVGEWKYPPFSGTIEDGKVWGRGAVDNKGSLICILEAMENLLENGFKPKNDIYILSTSREEIAGADGEEVSKFFADSKVRFSLVLDEGGAILSDPIAGVKGDFAMIALSERGRIKFKATASGENAIDDITTFMRQAKKFKPGKLKFSEEVLKMFSELTPHMTGTLKFMFKRFKLFSPIIAKILSRASGEARAMLLPTVSMSTPNDKEKENDIIGDFSIMLTVSHTYHADTELIEVELNELAKKCNIKIKKVAELMAVKPEQADSNGYKIIADTVLSSFSGVTPCPFILFGATDSRHFVGISDSVIRFSPIRLSKQQLKSFHKINENIDIEALDRAVVFYENLIKQH